MKDVRILYKKEDAGKVYIIAESIKESAVYPNCGESSTTKHSRYSRKVMNGSFEGVTTDILLIVRKFKCKNKDSTQKIFTERLDFVSPYGRKTNQVIQIVTLLAFMTSAEKVVTLMNKLGIKISNDTVLRIIKKLPVCPSVDAGKVINIGVDDFALKRGISRHHHLQSRHKTSP